MKKTSSFATALCLLIMPGAVVSAHDVMKNLRPGAAAVDTSVRNLGRGDNGNDNACNGICNALDNACGDSICTDPSGPGGGEFRNLILILSNLDRF